MKKLLSICFLSMLLGLLSFGVRAQNDNGCKSGFWIENLQPDTIYGVVNMPPDGKLPLVHTLGTGHYYPNSGVFKSNVMPGEKQMYELHFCNTCGLDPKTKVSLDWVLLRFNEATGEWEEVNANLSDYVDFYIFTYYAKLNQEGACQSIGWLGGQVENGFGYCEDQAINSGISDYDQIQGNFNPCSPWTNYPGAMHVGQGTPMAVLTQLGQIVPAAGQVNIYSQNHDYFYLDFFEQTRNLVYLDWKQVGNYKLVMRVRERLGGTPWTNEFWRLRPSNDGTYTETDYVGGHQSCCGDVIVEDTIGFPIFGEACKEVCEGESYVYGRPPYTFNVTMPDTNVVFGEFRGAEGDAECQYFHTDSVNRFHFFVRETPQVQTQNIAICKCSDFGPNDLNALVTLADTANKGVFAVRLEWATSITGPWSVIIPTPPTAVGTYTYYVRQTNIYQLCGETVECTGPAAPIILTIRELPAPTGGSYDICNENEATTMTLTVSRASDIHHCSTTSVWKLLNGDSVYTGDSYVVNLADLRPATNMDKVVTYHVYAYNAATNCYSADYSVVTLTFHQTPEIQLTYLDTICPRPDNVYFTMVVTSNQTEFPYTVYQVSDFDANDTAHLYNPVNQQVTNYHKPYTKITDFECDGVYHLYYKVVDANGCFVRDTATFIAKDIIAPIVEPATWAETFNVCNFEGDNRPDTIKMGEEWDENLFAGLTTVTDECGIDHFTCKDSTYVVDSCENVLLRTYTFYDYCNNASTFTQTFTAHDSTAPYFVGTPNRPIYERLNPKRDTSCTFNSLSKEEFVMAFLGKVQDNCVEFDSAYLFNHSDFYWEESSQFGHVLAYNTKDIFRDLVGNQLTVEVLVWDDCHNLADTLAFWFEPDTLIVPNVTVNPAVICLGDTAYLTFDSSLVDFGHHFDVAHPLTFQWGSQEDDAIINFDNKNTVNTYVVPTEGGIYHVNMTVTDFYGCSNSSEYAEIEVHAAPDIVIIPHENNACQPPYTYIPGQPIIWQGSYSPNVGIVWLAARDASNPSQTIPNLTYQWTTSQSVNILSDKDTTGLWIVPDSCSYIYDAQVKVTDLYGCVAVDSIWVPVKDTAPTYIGGPHHDIRPLEEECRMTVGDYTHYVIDSLQSSCGYWPPKKIWQVPADTAELTMDTNVTVYVVSQCGEDTLAITDKFRSLVYRDRIHVTATVEPAEECEPATFNFNATATLTTGPVTYYWTKGIDTLSYSQSFSNTDTVEEGASVSVYVYTVTAIDSVNCVATDNISVTVHETLPEPEYEVFPNTRCVELYNGLIRLKNMPKGYSYKLYYDEERTNLIDSIITQIPAWDDSVPVTSIIFDELAGDHTYWVLIITDFGCETFFSVDVPDVRVNPEFHGEVTTVNPTHCSNDNGSINIEVEPGFTYYVFDEFGNEILYPYQDLPVGPYTVYKENDTTLCTSFIIKNILPSTTSLSFTVTPTSNTSCTPPFNGKLKFTKTNVWFVVTDIAEGSVIYEGPSTTLTGLHSGDYTVYGVDTVTGCERTYTKHVGNNTNNPVFSVTPRPNQYCQNEANLVNGHVDIIASGSYTYEYFTDSDVLVSDPEHLAAGSYYVVATNASNCTTTHYFDIVDSTVAPVVADSTVENTVCNPEIAAYDGKVILTITNYDVNNAPYNVTLDAFNEDGTVYNLFTIENAISPVTFNSLDSGVYHYSITDKYMCVTEGQVRVEQELLPDLILKQTPNTYCIGTYNKPGNGTITVMSPFDSVQNYFYSYFYAPIGMFEKGDDVEVDYDNLINRFYWLRDTLYYVEVIDLRTGCVLADTITVELARDTVLLTGDPTPNTNCIEPFNGQIQLHTSFIPAEFDYSHLPLEPVNIPAVLYPNHRYYKYSIDGGLTYQMDSLFTNLEDGVYYFSVIDTITGCVYEDFDSIVVAKTDNDIVIVPTVTPNHACVEGLYDGTITVTASSEMFNPAEFVFSFEDGEFSTVNTWNSLNAGVYHIVAREINSGCENSIYVEVNTDNECTPIIDVDVRKYCLGEENATITAHAYYPEDSDCEGDFTYRWHKECHNEYFDGPTAPVSTEEEMCCYYTVTATNTLTGCINSTRVEVCVYAAHTIEYTVNHEPIVGNSTEVCENESLYIGVVENGWAEAWWTMNHKTVLPDDNPEYEFFVSTPDSIAAYVSDPNKWKFNRNISFCLDVVDTNGCPARGLFNLVIHPLVRLTTEETVCELPLNIGQIGNNFPADPTTGATYEVGTPALDGYDIDEETMAAIEAGIYPYSVSRTDTIPSVGEGCDTVLTTVLTVLGKPNITGQLLNSYCEGTTIGQLMSSITITNYVEETLHIYLNNVEVTAEDALTYNGNDICNTLVITCSSSTEMQCESTKEFHFLVNAAPELEPIEEIGDLCASEEGVMTIPFFYDCRFINGSCDENNEPVIEEDPETNTCTVEIILKDSEDAVEYTVLEYTVFDQFYYEVTPIKLSYNGKYLGFRVTNDCNTSYSNLIQLHVDTIPVGYVDTNAICAGQQFADLASIVITNLDDLLDPSHVYNYTYVKKVDQTDFTLVDPMQTVDYSYNGAEMYAVLVGNNQCGSYTTETVNIKVSDKPTIHINAQALTVCADAFEEEFATTFGSYIPGSTTAENPTILDDQFEPMKYDADVPVPEDLSTLDQFNYVLANGTPFTHTYWATATRDEEGNIVSYDSVSVEDIRTAATDNCVDIYYFAANACGSVTDGPFPVCIIDEPEITYITGDICLDKKVREVLTITDINWHNYEGTYGYSLVAVGDEIGTGEPVDAEMTMESLLGYNGYRLVFTATNYCNSASVEVLLNIPWWEVEDGVMKDACVGSVFSAFIETEPSLELHNTTVESQGWYVYNATATAAVADEEITLTTVVDNPIDVYYKWVTACGDIITSDTVTLGLLYQPEVTISDITICAGSTIDITEAHLDIQDPSVIVSGEPTWTINGEPYSETATYGYEYNNADIVVTVPTDCDPVTYTATLHVNQTPEVEVSGDDVCAGSEATFTATSGFASYTFTLDDGAPVTQESNVFTQTLDVDETLNTFHTVTVSVVDANGCASTVDGSVTVKATGAPEFIFKTLDGTETHLFEDANMGEQFQYIWMVGGDCNAEDLLVYVEYDIYYEDQLLNLNNIGDYFCIQNSSANGTNREWNTANALRFKDSDGRWIYNISYYLGATPGTPEEMHMYNYYGNHFPYSSLVHNYPTSNYYDDLWMHFLRDREITQTVAPFRHGGDYKLVFRLYQTNRPNNFQNIHTDTHGVICPEGETNNHYPALGGSGFNTDFADGTPPTLTLLAIDSIIIRVAGEEGLEFVCNPTEAAPSLAPEFTVDESKIAPDMEVWPNPAPAITTTLKARVHNMGGQEATVTLTTLRGTQVYSGNYFIDNDNYQFEFGVNNLNVGTYILTVRSSDAIITKKVVVTSLAY